MTAPYRASSDPSRDPAHDALLERWDALLLRARDGRPGPPPRGYGEELLARWAEPHRRYHTVQHLHAVLDRVDELGAFARQPDAVLLAAWFHDAVYQPDRSENEERSAQLARRALREAGVPQARVTEVTRLVRLTVHHDPEPGDVDGEVLCDADLAVLADSPEEYAAYAAAVREEYAFVPEAAFREGRARLLRALLDRPRVYRTSRAYERWEHTARRNVRTELELLETG